MDALFSLFTPANLATAIVAMNFIAFTAFGLDKAKAAAGKRRISEADLLLLALIGGTPGAYAARAAFRHKTRKQPFSARLHGIAALQIALVTAWAVWSFAG